METDRIALIAKTHPSSWVKIRRYEEKSLDNSTVDWKSAYFELLSHHKKETEFLIETCKQLANIIIERN